MGSRTSAVTTSRRQNLLDQITEAIARREQIARNVASGKLTRAEARTQSKVNELLLRSMQARSFYRRLTLVEQATAALLARIRE